jgi:DNA-binding response OmpR family regulator
MEQPTVLIADADEVYRRHVRDFLTRMDNFAVFDVGSGETAVNIAVQKQPSVVMLDLLLPDISGIEVCRKLKSDEKLRHIPVIIHTAKIGLRDRLSAFIAGAHEYLAKPCNLDDIYYSLQGALRQYEYQRASMATTIDRMSRS